MAGADEAWRALEHARDLQVPLAAAAPADNNRQAALARSHGTIGILLSETGKPAEALTADEAGRAIQPALARANPAITAFQSDLAWSHSNIGLVLSNSGRPDEAHPDKRALSREGRGATGDGIAPIGVSSTTSRGVAKEVGRACPGGQACATGSRRRRF